MIKDLEVLLVGTNLGALRVYLWPIDINDNKAQYLEIEAHQGPVTSIQISYDLSLLMTGGADSQINFYQVRYFEKGTEMPNLQKQLSKQPDKTQLYYLDKFALISEVNQSQIKDVIKELDFKIQNFKSDIEDELEKKAQQISHNERDLEDKNRQVLSNLKEKLANAMEECDL